MKSLITFVMTAAFGLGGAMAGEAVSYVFLNDRIGNPGSQTVERSDDGVFSVKFIYKNNGRGPVTAAAGELQRRGLIEYHRGVLTVLDRGELERAACACYASGRRAYARQLP